MWPYPVILVRSTDNVLMDTDLRQLLGPVFEHSVVATLIVDPFGAVLAANERANKLLSSALGSVVGQRFEESLSPSDADYLDRATLDFQACTADQLHRAVELINLAGDVLTVEMTADVVTSAAGRRLWLVQLNDVTRARRDLRELEASERRYRHLANSLPESSVTMFDRDLRITVALGEVWIRNGYQPDDLIGQLLSEALPPKAFALVEQRYQAALAGTSSDFEYVSPVTGRRFRTQILPVTDPDGAIVGGLALAGDVSAERERQARLEQVYRLTPVGSCSFNAKDGWSYDQKLVQLWGLDPATPDIGAAFAASVLDEDRLALRAAQERLCLVGGRSSFAYRIRHPATGEIRRLHCTFESTISSDALLNATATHIDVTDAFLAGSDRVAEQAAADQRSMLLRKISDAVADAQLSPEAYLRSIVDLAATDLQAAAMLRVLAPDLQSLQIQAIAHPDTRTSDDINRAMALSMQCFEPGPIRDQVIRQARIVCTTGPHNRLPNHTRLAEQTGWTVEHSITAPIRHGGKVLGLFSVMRDDPARPFGAGDENLVQVLADFAGAAVAGHRAREAVQREAAQRFDDMTVSQKALLEELAGMELRERSRIADIIYARPIQLIVAAAMRIDQLSAGSLQTHSTELDRLAMLLEDSVDSLRSLADVNLAAPNLSRGLIEALRNLGQTVISPTRQLKVTGPDFITISAQTAAAVYSVVREALLNAEKHAHAKHVTVAVMVDHQQMVVTVTDDGVGASGLPGPEHQGLAAMRIRAEAEGGQMTIRSTPGAGTAIVLTVPASQP